MFSSFAVMKNRLGFLICFLITSVLLTSCQNADKYSQNSIDCEICSVHTSQKQKDVLYQSGSYGSGNIFKPEYGQGHICIEVPGFPNPVRRSCKATCPDGTPKAGQEVYGYFDGQNCSFRQGICGDNASCTHPCIQVVPNCPRGSRAEINRCGCPTGRCIRVGQERCVRRVECSEGDVRRLIGSRNSDGECTFPDVDACAVDCPCPVAENCENGQLPVRGRVTCGDGNVRRICPQSRCGQPGEGDETCETLGIPESRCDDDVTGCPCYSGDFCNPNASPRIRRERRLIERIRQRNSCTNPCPTPVCSSSSSSSGGTTSSSSSGGTSSSSSSSGDTSSSSSGGAGTCECPTSNPDCGDFPRVPSQYQFLCPDGTNRQCTRFNCLNQSTTEPPLEFRSCSEDSDCALVESPCPCTAGGVRFAINSDFADEWSQFLSLVRPSIVCPQVISNDPSCSNNAAPRCQDVPDITGRRCTVVNQ